MSAAVSVRLVPSRHGLVPEPPRLSGLAYAEIERLLLAGRSLASIAPLYGLGRCTLRLRLKRLGRRCAPARPVLSARQERIWRLREEGTEYFHIAERFGMKEARVRWEVSECRRKLAGLPRNRP